MSQTLAHKAKVRTFYDQIADLHDLTFSLNGYRRAIADYLRDAPQLPRAPKCALDAGCGSGLMTSALYSAGITPQKTFALDLSFRSLAIARQNFARDRVVAQARVHPVEGNLLNLPFADGSFDLIVTCGALEYISLEDGMREMARLLAPDGALVFLPNRRSVLSKALEVLYNFKIHPLEKVREVNEKYFRTVEVFDFPAVEPIGWSKTLYLLRKK